MIHLYDRKHRRAYKLGRYRGRNVYRVPVVALLNDSRACATVDRLETTVTAHNAADAANYIRNHFRTRAETEVYAWGPKGGEVYRYVGWDTAIWNSMQLDKQPHQLELSL